MLHTVVKILKGVVLFSILMIFFVVLRFSSDVSHLVPKRLESDELNLPTMEVLQNPSTTQVSLLALEVNSSVYSKKKTLTSAASNDDDIDLGSFHIRKRDYRYYAFDDDLIIEMSLSWVLYDLGLEVRLNCRKNGNTEVSRTEALLVICLNSTHLTEVAMARKLTRFEAKLLVLMSIFNKLGGNGKAVMRRGQRAGELSVKFNKFVTSQLAFLIAKRLQEKSGTKLGRFKEVESMKWNDSFHMDIHRSSETT